MEALLNYHKRLVLGLSQALQVLYRTTRSPNLPSLKD